MPTLPERVIVIDTLIQPFLNECAQQEYDIHPTPMREPEFLSLLGSTTVLGIYTENGAILTKLRTHVPTIQIMYKHEISLTSETALVLIDLNNPVMPYILYTASPTLSGFAKNQAKKIWSNYILA